MLLTIPTERVTVVHTSHAMRLMRRLWLGSSDGRYGASHKKESAMAFDNQKQRILAAMSCGSTRFETLFGGVCLPWRPPPRRRAPKGSIKSTIRQPSDGYIALRQDVGPSILQELLDQTLAQVDPALKRGLEMMPAAYRARCLRAYLVQTKTDSYNGSHRLHFEPLYDDASAADSPDSVAARKIQQFAAQNPDAVVKVMFFISRFCAPGPPKRYFYENLDDVIRELFVQNLRSCWNIVAEAPPSPPPAVPLPPVECRERVLKRMSDALRDSVLNDLLCSGDHLSCSVVAPDSQQEHKASICNVLKSLLRNGDNAHTDGPLRSLVVIKSDTFSHFSHCDENCETVNACILVHFHWPKDMLELAVATYTRHIYGEESDEMLLHKQVLESQFIKDFAKTLKAKGFDLEVDVLNANSTFCSLKLFFPVRRSLHDPGCMGMHVAALKIAIAEVLQAQGVEKKGLNVDDQQVCLAKGLHCPTCSFCSDDHSMFQFRRTCKDAKHLHQYIHIFESASGVLPELESADKPVCRGLDQGPEDIHWLQRITRSEQAKGHRMKKVQPSTFLSDVQIGDVVLSSRSDSYSTDMGANLERYATPRKGKSKSTVFMIKRPHVNSRFVDPISIIPFLSPSFRECECHIEKDAELRLTEIKANTRGEVTGGSAECCTTYVFSLVSNINALSPIGIANLKLPGIRLKTAEKLHRGLHSVAQKCRNLEDFMEEIEESCTGMRQTHKDDLKQKVQAEISEGRLSFGCEIQILPDSSFDSPQKPKPTDSVSPPSPATEPVRPPTPATEPRRKPVKSKQARDAELPEDYSVPILFPLLKKQCSDASDSHEWFWCGSGKSIWGGGLLPRGTCPLQAHSPARFLVYTFKQLLCAQYYDGNCYQCVCEDASNPSQQSLLEEAETIDDFMSRLRHRNCLTQQDIANSFEISASIAKTHTALRNDRETLAIRDDFLEQCLQVIGLRMPELPCQEVACGCQVRAPVRNLYYEWLALILMVAAGTCGSRYT